MVFVEFLTPIIKLSSLVELAVSLLPNDVFLDKHGHLWRNSLVLAIALIHVIVEIITAKVIHPTALTHDAHLITIVVAVPLTFILR